MISEDSPSLLIIFDVFEAPEPTKYYFESILKLFKIHYSLNNHKFLLGRPKPAVRGFDQNLYFWWNKN